MIYLDYHSTTPCAPEAVAAMFPYFTEKFGNPRARSHANGRLAAKKMEECKDAIGALIRADGENMHLCASATDANCIAIEGIAKQADSRREILISAIEHSSVLNPARELEAQGFTVKVIPVNSEGIVTEEALQALLSPQTLLVCIQAANNEIGTVQDIPTLAKHAHEAGAFFLCDATQAVGKMLLDASHVDMLSFSSHKIYGPCGIGALYLRTSPPLPLSLPQEPSSLALAVGFAEAAQLCNERFTQDQQHLTQCTEAFLEALGKVQINGSKSARIPGSLSITLPVAAEELMLELHDQLCLSTGSACNSASRKPSPILRAIGLSDDEIHRTIRVSFGRPTTLADAQEAGKRIRNAVARLSAEQRRA